MSTLIPGYLYEQLVVTVANTDIAMNAEITAQALAEYVLNQMVIYPDGTMVILQFSRTIPAP